MKHLLTALALFAFLTAGAQRTEISLAGTWQSSLGECRLPGTTDENHLGGPRVTSGPTSQLTRLYPYRGIVTYERTVHLPKSMEGQVLSLYIERTKPSTLWVDGDSIGSIGLLAAPHVYRLPPLKAGPHRITLRIDNRDEAVPSGVHGSHAWTDATQTNWNGLLGRLVIEAVPRTHIADLQVYPDIHRREAKVRLTLVADRKTACRIALTLDNGARHEENVTLTTGENRVELRMAMDNELCTWSEFHPHLYTLTASIHTRKGTDSLTRRFGMRQFTTEGTQFVINGKKTFLRGTHDGCVFPLTGYAPTDVGEWRRLFSIAQQYGLNHFRFHSYTPPEAAFEAADELGVYLHAELPLWGRIDSTTAGQNEYLRREAFATLRFLGNHPSFVGFGLGNELWGDTAMMHRWLDDFRAADPRHLYCMGANNDLGWRGPKQGEDLYITCRVGGGEGFSTHARTSFSFADADHGGLLNGERPNTQRTFHRAVDLCPVPIVSHESGQFQIYPDYRDLPKYAGVLYPYSLETFRQRLQQNGLTPQIDAFHQATGRWAVECYKADMEMCRRTEGFGGFQLLDIKDYPGQGSALVGVLDAFMDSKGLVEPATFRQWNAPVVPLALLPSHCFTTADTLRFGVALSNYSEDDFRQPLRWTLGTEQGEVMAEAPQGTVRQVATVEVPLRSFGPASLLTLTLSTGPYQNSYRLWVYDDADVPSIALEADSLSAAVEQALLAGGTVLLCPRHADIEGQSVGGLFTPDYWNYAMFKSISENNRRPVSPGTLGLLMDPEHPLFDSFPTEGRSDWQWWSVALHSRPLVLNALPRDYLPLVQAVDNVERNHKLGILMEFRVGQGRLLLCTTRLDALSAYPEGRAYARALRRYVASHDFQPRHTLSVAQLRSLLYSQTAELHIQGVRNITDYKH
ncbi:MAG: glycoside hydrolase [Bacteroidaceae bacterium]|nr:glycoside hydrolase [Bacteroidaceae bacterium]